MYRLFEHGKQLKLDDLPKDSNLVNFSLLKQVDGPVSFRSFSIKYVLEGCEWYTVNGKEYRIGSGQYLLANNFCQGEGIIDSREIVTGLCIDVSSQMISEAVASHLTPDSPFPDLSLDTFFTTDAFLENRYDHTDKRLGQTLLHTAQALADDPYADHAFGDDFFFTLAENIIADHRQLIGQLYGIGTVRHGTRKDLYRRVCNGKAYIDAHFTEKMDIGRVAMEAALSEYHFFRLFKAAFAITPHRYIIDRRLQHAVMLLKGGHHSITETAEAVGFADVQSFSKSFSRRFGMPPSAIQEGRGLMLPSSFLLV